jgi:hypothetical protein
MYRHFAVVTVAITLLIALFADGENREAIGNELKAQQQQTEMRRAEAEKFGPKKLGGEKIPRRDGGGWGDEGPVDPGGAAVSGSAITVTRENGDVEHASTYDQGVIGPGPQMMQAGGNVSKTGPLPPKRFRPTPKQRAEMERAGLAAAAAGAAKP